MRFIILSMLLLGTAGLAGCDGSSPANQAAPEALVADPSASLRALPEDRQLQLAFSTAFPAPEGAEQRIDDTLYTFAPQRLLWIGQQAVLISGGQTDDCHACTGTLAVHYLRPAGDAFAVEGAWTQAATGTSWGAPPDWNIRSDLDASPVIQAESGGTWQGHTCRFAQLVALRPQGPATIADHIPLSYSNASGLGQGTPEDYQGRIEAGEDGQSFTVVYAGTRKDRIDYRREGEGFVPAPGSPELPGC